jgi:hypothetical protein
MPIRPENKARYPRNWKTEVVPRIAARSGNRCECTGICGKQHGPDVDGRCLRRNGEVGFWCGEAFQPFRPLFNNGEKIVKIVLTVMHLNHTPEDCDDGNLLHGCQGCHNRYDAAERAKGRLARRNKSGDAPTLFDKTTT